MKKHIFYLAFLSLIGSSFISCKDAGQEETEEIEINDVELEEEAEVVSSEFNDYDINNDGKWDPNEFEASKTVSYITWDSNNDGNLDNDEFYRSTFAVVDTNKDEILSRQEWDSERNNMFRNYFDEEDFDLFDEDEDGLLDNEEWNEGLKDSDWFNSYDADRNIQIDDNEWRSGLFNDLDADDDRLLDENEYTAYSENYV